MAPPSIAHATDTHKPRSHRKAYGSHRRMCPLIRARNIAQSIALRLDEQRPYAFSDYGIADEPQMIELVYEALARLT